MLASSPTLTSPISTAVGATKALGDTAGFLPLYSMIIQMFSSAEYFATIFDEQGEIKVGSGLKIFIVKWNPAKLANSL
jgi:hypothetical protein